MLLTAEFVITLPRTLKLALQHSLILVLRPLQATNGTMCVEQLEMCLAHLKCSVTFSAIAVLLALFRLLFASLDLSLLHARHVP